MKHMAKFVFMGSPAFALPTLQALSREHELLAVYTQPDRPAGRGRKLAPSAVKVWAEAQGAPIYQAPSLRREPIAVEVLRTLQPEVVIVVAYGLILPQTVLDIPPHGCLNVHASLLPRYRGAAPIPAAILAGDEETGVTVMRMDAGLDTGAMLAKARTPIQPDDTTQSLSERLAQLGAQLMVETLPKYLKGEITPEPQDESQASLSPKIEKNDGRIDWSKPGIEIERMLRAYTPWPGVFSEWQGQRLKIVRASAGKQAVMPGAYRAGQVAQFAPERIGVATGDGLLELHEVQLAGKRAVAIDEFVRGHPRFVGSSLE
jgi:methionyl-tRNA formyltransferase